MGLLPVYYDRDDILEYKDLENNVSLLAWKHPNKTFWNVRWFYVENGRIKTYFETTAETKKQAKLILDGWKEEIEMNEYV